MPNDADRWQEIEDAVRLLRYAHINSRDGIAPTRLVEVAAKHGAHLDDVRTMFDAAVERNEFPRPDDMSRLVTTSTGTTHAKPVDGAPKKEPWTCPVCGLQFSAMGSYNHLAACRKKHATQEPPTEVEADTPAAAEADEPHKPEPDRVQVSTPAGAGHAMDPAPDWETQLLGPEADAADTPSLVNPNGWPGFWDIVERLAETAHYHPHPAVARAAINAHERLRDVARLMCDFEQLEELRAQVRELEQLRARLEEVEGRLGTQPGEVAA